MAQVVIDVPNAQVTRVIAALCAVAGLPASPANAKQAVADHIRTIVMSYERSQAERTAIASVPAPADTGVT